MLSLVYLAAALRNSGYEVEIIDGHFQKLDEKAVCERAASSNAGLIGITAMTHEVPRAVKIAEFVKQSGKAAPIVFGGPHATALPAETLKECEYFDYVIAGEGEDSLVKLANYVRNGGSCADISGLAYREEEVVKFNPAGNGFVQPDKIRMPAVDLYYNPGHFKNAKHDEYRIFTSRGCPYNCSFCMQVLGRKVRFRPVEHVLEEWRQAVEVYGAEKVFAHDEIFLWNNERTHRILEGLMEMGLHKKHYWYAMTRVNLLNDELLRKAKAAGCRRIYIGVESGNDFILDRIHRKYTAGQAIEAVKRIKEAGLEVFTFFILGHPGESDGTVIDSILTAVRMGPTEMGMGVMVPYPGTEIHKLACAGEGGYRLTGAGWETYDRYGGCAMEIKGLSGKKLMFYQVCAYLTMYLYNLQFRNMIRYFGRRLKAVFKLLTGGRL